MPYPDADIVVVNTSAGEILKRCDGKATLADITASLEQSFGASGLSGDVFAFIGMAVEKKWVTLLS